ncbi:MAG: tetratricopeptide repeat protein, partial [Bradyrhizobium sp.]
MTDIAPKRPPLLPKPSSPAISTLVLVAVVGMIVGTTIQECRWRHSTAPSEKKLEQTITRGDNPAALKLMNDLAGQKNPNAEYWLGHMAEIGLGVPRDTKKAIDFYKRAADQNVVAAEARLGDIYLNGNIGFRHVRGIWFPVADYHQPGSVAENQQSDHPHHQDH